MEYHVLILSRIRELRLSGAPARVAVTEGITHLADPGAECRHRLLAAFFGFRHPAAVVRDQVTRHDRPPWHRWQFGRPPAEYRRQQLAAHGVRATAADAGRAP
jgi:hypothetical protein